MGRPDPVSAAGIILCGGKSSRMGRAKAWLPWGGQPMVVHVANVLRNCVDEIIVVSSESLELPPLDARIVRDRKPELGPLAGIREGLAHISADRAFVTSTDAPFLTPAFVEALLAFAGAVAPVADGHVQTLSAVYPAEALEYAADLLDAGRMRPLFLLEQLDYRQVPEGDLPDIASVRGFNTPDAYLEAVRGSCEGATAVIEFLGRSRMLMGRRELEVPVGTLAEVLAHANPALELVDGDRVARPFLVSLDGHSFVRDVAIPVGAGEHVIILDASVGG